MKYTIWGLNYIKKQGSWREKELAFYKREQVKGESTTWGRIPHKAKLDKFKIRRQFLNPDCIYWSPTKQEECGLQGWNPALLISVGPEAGGRNLPF